MWKMIEALNADEHYLETGWAMESTAIAKAFYAYDKLSQCTDKDDNIIAMWRNVGSDAFGSIQSVHYVWTKLNRETGKLWITPDKQLLTNGILLRLDCLAKDRGF